MQSVTYVSCNRICCPTAEVLLCVPAAVVAPRLCPPGDEEAPDQPFEYSYIEAEIFSETLINQTCNVSVWQYVFMFDEAQLVEDTILISTNITGVLCRNCLIDFIEQLVGDESYIRTEEDDTQTFISEHGCEYPILQAAQSDDWHILGNAGTVDGTNFLGTTDNVAHDVRVNNVRIRRNVPDPSGGVIIDGMPDTIMGVNVTGCTVGGGGSDPDGTATPHEIEGGNFSTIGGGAGNLLIPDAYPENPVGGSDFSGYSTIAGGQLNIIQCDEIPWEDQEDNGPQGYNFIGGGFDNLITIAGDYSVVCGGFVNKISYVPDTDDEVFSAINYIWADAIVGGIANEILGISGFGATGDSADELGANFIGCGGGNSIGNGIDSSVVGGSDNSITNFWNDGGGNIDDVNGPLYASIIAGGAQNLISHATRSGVGSGGFNMLRGNDVSGIFSGYLNRINVTTPVATPLGQEPGGNNIEVDPPASVGVGNAILGGEANWIVDGWGSSILGGAFLRIGKWTFGYQSPGTRTFTAINGGNRNTNMPAGDSFEIPQVDVSAFNGIGYLGDIDLWIGNTDNTARKVKFFEPNTDLDFSSSHYSSLQAQAQAASIEYVLPAAAGVAGQSLKIQSVVGPVVTLEWA